MAFRCHCASLSHGHGGIPRRPAAEPGPADCGTTSRLKASVNFQEAGANRRSALPVSRNQTWKARGSFDSTRSLPVSHGPLPVAASAGSAAPSPRGAPAGRKPSATPAVTHAGSNQAAATVTSGLGLQVQVRKVELSRRRRLGLGLGASKSRRQGADTPVPVPVPVPDLSGDSDGDGASRSVPDLAGDGDAPSPPSRPRFVRTRRTRNRGLSPVPVPDLPGLKSGTRLWC